MKIAIPTRNNQLDEHFGHCESYTIMSVSADNKIEKMETLPSPQGCGCKSNIVAVFQQIGVTTMLAGNIGQGAIDKISTAGIEVVKGCSGEVRLLAENYLNNKITDSGAICDHHDHDHQCNH